MSVLLTQPPKNIEVVDQVPKNVEDVNEVAQPHKNVMPNFTGLQNRTFNFYSA